MAQGTRIGIELDERCVMALLSEAQRLGTSPEEVAKRAVSAWLNDMVDDQPVPRAEEPARMASPPAL